MTTMEGGPVVECEVCHPPVNHGEDRAERAHPPRKRREEPGVPHHPPKRQKPTGVPVNPTTLPMMSQRR